MVRFLHQFLLVLLVAIAPTVVLLLRGLVWGADSFAFMAVSCGKPFVQSIGHLFFAQLVPLFDCNFLLIVGLMFVFYFFGLIGLWVFGNRVLKERGFLLPFVVGSVSPLFFLEALRFENELFGFSLALIGLGLFSLYLSSKNKHIKTSSIILCGIAYAFSFFFWYPSILLLAPALLLLNFSVKTKNKVMIGLGILGIAYFLPTIIFSFQQLLNPSLIAEEIPLIGIVFILHIVHLYKHVPKNFYLLTIGLILIGIIKSKYMFLSIPFIAMGVIRKDHVQGLWIRGNKLPLIPICLYLLLGFCVMGLNLYPTQPDIVEIDELILLSNESGHQIYNDWGQGWLFEWRGHNTEYKMSIPQPEWLELEKPFYAYTFYPNDLPECIQLDKRSYFCS